MHNPQVNNKSTLQITKISAPSLNVKKTMCPFLVIFGKGTIFGEEGIKEKELRCLRLKKTSKSWMEDRWVIEELAKANGGIQSRHPENPSNASQSIKSH